MPEVLQPTVYNPTAVGAMSYAEEAAVSQAEDSAPNTQYAYTDDEGTIPRYYFTPSYSPTSTYQPSESSPVNYGDFPTPKARLFDMTTDVLQPSPRRFHHRKSRADSDFDSLYDVTDDEAEVPLKLSGSMKKIARNRYPSIDIPSPSVWPTIEKLQSARSAVPPTSAQLLSPSRQALNLITTHNLTVSEQSAAPSLDGSLTSEEMDKLSCPATPDLQKRSDASFESDWEPVQLDFQALETLQHLGQSTSDIAHEQQTNQVIEAEAGEMREVGRPFLGLQIPSAASNSNSISNTPLSALSIPSPGGFFSSLRDTARHTWSMGPSKEDAEPNTSTAEEFYGIPWDTSAIRNSTLAGSTLDGLDGGLPTPKAFPPIAEEEMEVKEINPSKTIFEYNESYHADLEKMTSVHLERTSHWLDEQGELQAALRDMGDLSSPTAQGAHSRESSLTKITRKKSVKFADKVEQFPADREEDEEPKKIDTYIQGFEYLRNQTQKQDAYIHRQTRAEAMHLRRRCMSQAHRDQLLGKFELNDPVRPAPSRPVSEFFVNDPTALKERIARAQSERQALDQMQPRTWVLQALKQVNGGKLLSKPATKCVSRSSEPRILDVGGVVTNDWAWEVAFDHPNATVTTVYTAGQNLTSNVQGPDNHKHTVVPNMWTFPFPSGHFDVISARSLYELLKTDKPLGRSADEYDLCIKECFRCLKPGGVFEYSLMDADIIRAGRQAQAMGVEFGFNLKTRGYDAAPTKSFMPRLYKAGFTDLRRAWMVLPMGKTAANWKDTLPVGAEIQQERSITPEGEVQVGDAPVFGSTADAATMTGIIGSWMYERWMLKLQTEMGKDEEKLLEGVVQMLEEGAQQGSAWRYLTGFFKTLVDQEITVELKNEVCIRGTLKSVDQYLNIKLDNAEATDEGKWPHLVSTKDMFIRGSVVRYVHLPAGAVDTALLEDATRREAEATKNKAK
ncbi:hypothetical protein M011DRAFT_474433 [Sporormia fimetaria CBS 119925]|uniref:Sm domain-containing protein n=1 Tax=Sporormia fimetaria CBS 119925 TaxID=1340428 RepID=A0A6A6VN15_9PLEO|nr:hypothetical protein M011DRAFT_474433 [Sporormia fimetaria CBS 119925]